VIGNDPITAFCIQGDRFGLTPAGLEHASLIPQFPGPVLQGGEDDGSNTLSSFIGGYIHSFDLHGVGSELPDGAAADGGCSLIGYDGVANVIDPVELVVKGVLFSVEFCQEPVEVTYQHAEAGIVRVGALDRDHIRSISIDCIRYTGSFH